MKTCRICRQPFTPTRPMQPVCASFECRVAYATTQAEKSRQKREKAERQAIRKRREALKTRRDYINEAQTAFNAYIRERDKGLPCICCGVPIGWGVATSSVGGAGDCGHYRSVGSAPHLRFTEINAALQSKKCNRWGAGRAVDYRIGLIKRLGESLVAALEADQTSRKWSIEELIEIRDLYKWATKELKNEPSRD